MEITHGFFLNTLGNSTSFLIELFLQFPCKFHVLNPPPPLVCTFFWNSLFEVVFISNFTFAVFCCHGATATLRFHNSVLIFSYLSCFQKGIYLVYNDFFDVCPSFSYVVPLSFCKFHLSPTKSRTNDTLVSTTVPIVLQKVEPTIHWS